MCYILLFKTMQVDSLKIIAVSLNVFETNRSSHQRCSVKKGVLRNFAKFAKFLRTPFSQNTSARLLLNKQKKNM